MGTIRHPGGDIKEAVGEEPARGESGLEKWISESSAGGGIGKLGVEHSGRREVWELSLWAFPYLLCYVSCLLSSCIRYLLWLITEITVCFIL